MSGMRQDRRRLKGWALIGIFGVLLGTSSATNLALLCGLIVAALISRRQLKAVLTLSLIGCCMVLIAGTAVFHQFVFYGKSERKIETLSGRRHLWEGYRETFRERPVLGQGYAVTARVAPHLRTTNTHNSALSVLLGTGMAGMGILVWAFGRFAGEARAAIRRGRPGAAGCTAAVTAGLINSLAVAFLGETWMMSSLSFICIFGLFALRVATGMKVLKG
jgi:O-antigen ligase